jgi:hypothetical protein
MRSRRSKLLRITVLGLLAGGFAPFATSVSAGAADQPQPTFLESGDNDLIRFQKGDVPIIEGIDQLLEDTLVQPKKVKPNFALGRAKLKASPEPAAETDLMVESEAREEQPAETRDQKSADRLLAPSSPGIAPSATQVPLGGISSSAEVAPLAEKIVPPAPAPARLDDEIDARLVTVCLNNPDAASGAKAFDIRRDGAPRYVADIGATSCARFEPTRHTLYFWKSNELGALSLILSSRLDLNDADGTQVTLDWLRDK